MSPEQFAYWMQGFAELSGDAPPTPAQWKSIREHLNLVFKKVTHPVYIPTVTPVPTISPALPTPQPSWPQCPKDWQGYPIVTC